MDLNPILRAVETLPLAVTIRESPWLFPTIETIHVFALAIVVGTIARLDVRLLGFRSRDRDVGDLARESLPWTWAFFAFAAISGALMFAARAMTYGHSLAFQIKLAVLALAAVNMAIFHLTIYRTVATWGTDATPPVAARLTGGLSLLFWITIVVAGRWIGFTT
jgi:hypothetical protein